MSLNEWIRESPHRAVSLAACMDFTGGRVGAPVGLSFASPMLLALLLLEEVAVFYAYYLGHRRRYR
jgi:hypothetical protein